MKPPITWLCTRLSEVSTLCRCRRVASPISLIPPPSRGRVTSPPISIVAAVVILGQPVVADRPAGREDVVGLVEVEPGPLEPEVEMGGPIVAAIMLPGARDDRRCGRRYVLTLRRYLAQRSARQRRSARRNPPRSSDRLLRPAEALKLERAAPKQRRDAAVAARAARHRSAATLAVERPGEPAGRGRDEVEHLRLAGEFGAEQVARPDLDPGHPARRDAGQDRSRACRSSSSAAGR